MPPFRVPGNLQVDYQRLLTETAHLLLQDIDADTLCSSVFNLLREPFQLDVYFHYLVDDSRSGLILASSGGNEPARAALGTPLAFGQAVCGTVAQTCQWMYVTSVQHRNDEMTSLIRSFGVRCYTCQPLLVDGEIAGTISFGSCRRDAFLPEELDFFRLIAQQLAIVTARRRQNEYIRQLEQLATAGRMCATLAHEINNPLQSLIDLMYLIRDGVSTPADRAHVDEAEQQILRLSETTQRTLDLFRGKQQQPHQVEISRLAHELVANLRIGTGARFQHFIENDICANVIPGELRQVIFNLIKNAIQFTPQGGQVTFSLRAHEGKAEIRVQDDGPGITQKARLNLFKPFYTTRANGGTGLGLWISREMVERVGGTLTFESNPNLRPGTEFIVTLPIATM